MKAHPGFKAVQSKIAKKYGMKKAGAILAASSRNASAKAKKANPRLNRVRGK
jgi:predicted enzyme involved in methoxymalonyl-ACP biosynthesis